MTDVLSNIWYSDVSNEIVDNNSTEENEFREKFNGAIDKAKELYNLECEALAENALEGLNKEQLSAFLMVNYFEWWAKSYSKCRETWKFLDFSMKAALQLLSKDDTAKFDNNWNPSENWKTVDEIIKERWGMDLDNDSVLVKILQRKVGAHPDWKAGPQTIALVISALWGDISSIYDWVNSLAWSEKYRIQNITEFPIDWVNYKYDQNLFSLTTVDWKIFLTLKWSSKWKEVVMKDWKPTLAGFTFENWRIKKWNTNIESQQTLTVDLSNYHPEIQSFVTGNNAYLDLWENQNDYLTTLSELHSDSRKWQAFTSMMWLFPTFAKDGFNLDYTNLKLFVNNVWTRKFDSGKWVFHLENDKDEYCSLVWGRLVEYDNTWRSVSIFEVDWSATDDFRFDSMNAFFAWLWWAKLYKEKHVVKENADKDLNDWKDRFSDDVTSELLASIWSKWSDEYNTMISLLSLPEKFWWEYKMTTRDVENFVAWMIKKVFKKWLRKFHVEWAKFEVDGTHWPASDERFDSVSSFFSWLETRV